MSHIQQNYAFLLFCSIFGEIHRELLFLVQKLLSQKGVLKNSESLFFWTCLKRGKSWENLDLFKHSQLAAQTVKERELARRENWLHRQWRRENWQGERTAVLDQTSKRGQYYKNCFSPKSEPPTTKLCFSVVLNHFGGSHRELLILVKKWLSQKGARKNSEIFFFLTCLKRGKSWGKFGFV